MRKIVIILHNLRSANNVGSIIRTADGLGAEKVIMTGYTPYPSHGNDQRLPHIAKKVSGRIEKTALGAERTVNWEHAEDIVQVINRLKTEGYTVVALEQAAGSISLDQYEPPAKTAMIVGSEVTGLDENTLGLADGCLEIPMVGKKESFNVAVAAAIGLYSLITR